MDLVRAMYCRTGRARQRQRVQASSRVESSRVESGPVSQVGSSGGHLARLAISPGRHHCCPAGLSYSTSYQQCVRQGKTATQTCSLSPTIELVLSETIHGPVEMKFAKERPGVDKYYWRLEGLKLIPTSDLLLQLVAGASERLVRGHWGVLPSHPSWQWRALCGINLEICGRTGNQSL